MSQGVGCKCKKVKKSQEEWQKNLAETEEGLWFKQPSLIACTQQLSTSTAINLKSKLLSSGIEPWSVMWNCLLNYSFAGNCLAESLLGLPRILLCNYWYTGLYLNIWSPKSVILYLCKTLEKKKTYLHCTIRAKSKWMTTLQST